MKGEERHDKLGTRRNVIRLLSNTPRKSQLPVKLEMKVVEGERHEEKSEYLVFPCAERRGVGQSSLRAPKGELTMKRRYLMGMVVVMMAGAVLAQVGTSSKADPRLRYTLSEAGLKFTETENGNCKLHFTLEDGRTHVVVAESATQKMGPMEIREVWAVGWKGVQEPTAMVANRLLKDNGRKKVGAWEIHQQNDGTWMAIFNVKVSADCGAEALKTIVWGIATTADEMEKALENAGALSNKDEF